MRRQIIPAIKTPVSIAALLALAACGDNLAEQAAFGAGAGAAGAVALDVNLLTGAAAGAATNMAYCSTYPARC
ncbi:hypothetical protein [Mameliella sediminis]|uniref:hypothetical protein n=1 Tax=Mameliella sediminis TaxID=2836866 RepID=UPI001C455C98|nr:hypothetical protein [Mameliella sediminis]MBY6115799.1 hypothetical protein [Antarctobacter heliothermus]MBY6145423.1 hypothetical protein [Mameliella alba]MBV7393853.1 hypothetical protein [Mameliella sediminis]MBY6162234.1 hypothetical protein [Mameliella alba]MBY6170703.1 hypothetical protein [Mameliella alba]